MKRLGHYEILDELGRDGDTTIHRARDTQNDREVALKVLPTPVTQRPEFAKQFEESAKIAASLRHPRIVTVYDFGDDDGTLYLATRPTRGKTLRQFLNQHKRLTLGQALPILTQLAETLDYVEAQGLVYQALDPADVILESENEPPSVIITSIGEANEEVFGHERSFLPHVLALANLAFEMLTGRPSVRGELPTRASGRYTSAGALVAVLRSVNDRLIEQTHQTAEIMRILAQAQIVRCADDWLKVQALALQVMQRDHANTETLEMLAEAAATMYREKTTEARRLQLADLYKQGEQALQDGNWKGAVTAFEQVARVDPSYYEVLDKLAQATAEMQRAKLYDQAMMQSAAGELIQACRSWLALLIEQWDYRQGDAVQQFLDVVEDLLDQKDQENKSQHGEIFEPARTSSVLAESSAAIPDRLPNDPTQAKEWLDELTKQKTGRLERVLGWELEASDETPEALAQATTDSKLSGLTTKRTERLEGVPGQEPKISGKSSVNLVQADNWLDEQVSKGTERFEEVPAREVQKTTEVPENWAQTGGWLDIQATKKTESLVDHPYTASISQEQCLDNGRLTIGQDGKEMVRIPPGEFLYGRERKLVYLDEFWIDKAPITNAEYKRFLDAHPKYPVPFSDSDDDKPYNWDKRTRTFPQGMANHPVVLVSLKDVRSYAGWAGKRLPTEQEWEKAAQGIDGRTYPWGRTWRVSACNSAESGIGGPTPVGRFSPAGDSPYGCVDMSGNVWEWTASEFSKTTMVVRGGSWRNSNLDAWCVSRAGKLSGTVNNSIGFRLASSR